MTEDINPLPVQFHTTATEFSPEDAVNAFLEQMHATSTRVPYSCAARHFLYWRKLQDIPITAVNGAVLRRFAGHECSCPRYSAAQLRDPYYINRVRRFIRFLEDRGDIPFVNDVAELDQHLLRYAEHVASLGFNRLSQRRMTSAAEHFGMWLRAERVAWHEVNASVIERFAHHECGCGEGRKNGPTTKTGAQKRRLGATRFLAFLRQIGVLPAHQPAQTGEPGLEAYSTWLRQHRGATEKSIERYISEVARWLPELGPDPSCYEVSAIRAVVTNQPISRSGASIRMTATVLRSFLRFHAANGRCRAELQHAVPSVAPYRRSTLPRYADPAMIERVVAACGADTPARIRDRAIILLLARLGLRAGDVWLMRVTDIDWRQGLLKVQGKGRRSIHLPLPQDAGEAVAAYLQEVRPVVAEERLFLRIAAPFTPFVSSSEISGILARHLSRAGISGLPSGAHMFRHSLATRLLRDGAGLETVGAVLRHRSPDTTAIYAKVDIPMLQKIAQPWLGELTC